MRPPLTCEDCAFFVFRSATIQAASFILGATISFPASTTAVLVNSVALIAFNRFQDRFEGMASKIVLQETAHALSSAVSALAIGVLFGLGVGGMLSIVAGCFLYSSAPEILKFSGAYGSY